MKLTTLNGNFGKGKEDEAWNWPLYRGALVKLKQTRHEADHSKMGALVIIKQTRNKTDQYKGVLW